MIFRCATMQQLLLLLLLLLATIVLWFSHTQPT